MLLWRKSGKARKFPFILVLSLFAAVVWSVVTFVSMQVELSKKTEEYNELSYKLTELKTQNEQLERYANDDYRLEYIEQIARNELDYSYSDEKIYYFVPIN